MDQVWNMVFVSWDLNINLLHKAVALYSNGYALTVDICMLGSGVFMLQIEVW